VNAVFRPTAASRSDESLVGFEKQKVTKRNRAIDRRPPRRWVAEGSTAEADAPARPLTRAAWPPRFLR